MTVEGSAARAQTAASPISIFTVSNYRSGCEFGMHPVPLGGPFKRVGCAHRGAFFIEAAGEQKALRQALDESTGHHDLRMSGEIRGCETWAEGGGHKHVP